MPLRPPSLALATAATAGLLVLAGMALRPGHAQQDRPAGASGPGAPGAPGVPGAAPEGVFSFSAQGDRWAWLRRQGGEVLLFSGGPGATPQELARGKDWRDVWLEGDAAYVLAHDALLRVNADKSITRIAGSALPHAGLLVREGVAYWAEITAAPGLPYVPEGSPTLRIYSRPLASAEGAARLVASWPAPNAQGAGGVVRFLGLEQGVLTVQLQRMLSTEWVEVETRSGQVKVVAAASGAQSGTLQKGRLYWTAPSEEAASNSVMVRVCTRPPSGAEGEPQTLSEWLPGGGTLVATEGALFYAASMLYRLGQPGELAKELRLVSPGAVASDGTRPVLLNDGPAPQAVEAGL